jgi:hypothetical protein
MAMAPASDTPGSGTSCDSDYLSSEERAAAGFQMSRVTMRVDTQLDRREAVRISRPASSGVVLSARMIKRLTLYSPLSKTRSSFFETSQAKGKWAQDD